jgi:hypothetical protein
MQKSEDRANGEHVGRVLCVPEGVAGRSALAVLLPPDGWWLMAGCSPQHNSSSIAHYLPLVYYYLVGTSLETGTWSGVWKC